MMFCLVISTLINKWLRKGDNLSSVSVDGANGRGKSGTQGNVCVNSHCFTTFYIQKAFNC